MFWACIFLIFDSLDMGHFFHSPFLALFPSLPQFSLTPVLTFLTTKISSPLFLYFSTSATLPPYSPPPNFYPYLNKQANKQNTWMVSWPKEPFEVGVSFRWGRGGVRPRAASPRPGQLRKQSKLLRLRGSRQSAGAAQRLWSWKLLSGELTTQRRHWRPAATGASARGRPGGAYRTPRKEQNKTQLDKADSVAFLRDSGRLNMDREEHLPLLWSGWWGTLGFSESPPGHRFTAFIPGTATDRGEPLDGVVRD